MKQALKKTRPWFILVALVALVLALVNAKMSLLMMEIVDFALSGQSNQLLELGKELLIYALFLIPLDFLMVTSKTQYLKKSMLSVKGYYLSRLFSKNINEFQDENNALYLSNLTNDMNTLETKYYEPLLQIVIGSINFIVAIVLIAYIQPWVLLIALLFGVVMVGFSQLLGKPLQKPEKEKSTRLSEYTTYLKEIIGAFPIIKNNNLQQKISDNFYEYSKKVQFKNYEIDKKSTYLSAIQHAIIFAISTFGLAYVIVYSAKNNALTAGGVLLIVNNMGRIIGPLFEMMEITPKLKSVDLLVKEMDKNLTNKNTHEETLSLNHIDHLTFNDVAYQYDDNLVFSDVNLKFEPNKKYLIIGPSGQGKSTLLRLLRKYFAPTQGRILVNEQDLLDTKKIDYFNHLANIEQQVFLFEETLLNNITLFKDYPIEKIHQAIKQGGLENVVNEFEDGLDHMILDNGKNISGGQKARIAIARGLISDAKIILLDEAFASLDETVARQIEQTLLNLENVMVINVSHVVFKNTLDQYDEVLVVNHKQIKPLLKQV